MAQPALKTRDGIRAVKSPRRIFAIYALGVVGVGVALGAIFFVYWINSPQYALGEMSAALKRRDYAAFRNFVDIEKVVDAAFEDLSAETVQAATNFAGGLGAVLGRGLAQAMKPQMRAVVSQEINRLFDSLGGKGDAASNRKVGELQAGIEQIARMRGLTLDTTTFEFMKVEGDLVTLGLKIRDSTTNRTHILELKMENQERWMITRISNLRAVLQELAPGLVTPPP